MKTKLYQFFFMLVNCITIHTSCQNEDFQEENYPTEKTVDNPFSLSRETSVHEANAFLSQQVVKDGDLISLRSIKPESLKYSVKENSFSVPLENNVSGLKTKQNIPVHTINYQNSQGEQAGYVLIIADKRFDRKVIAFSETENIDLTTRPDADFLQEQINGYIYSVVNNTNSQIKAVQLEKDQVNLRSSAENVFYHHILGFNFNWHQLGTPFTDYTPFRNGQRASAGCVSVAMGMIMAWHQWPLQGAYPRYEKDTDGNIFLRDITTNYSPSTWSFFHPSDYRNKLKPTDFRIREHIADLLVEIGYKLNADFRSGTETYAYTDNIYAVFKQMGYDCPLSSAYFDGPKILKDIENKQPVLMSGRRTRTQQEILDKKMPSGHTFVATGIITQGATNDDGSYIDLKKPLYIYIMNGNAGSGDGWFLEELFSKNKYNFGADPDGYIDDSSSQAYKYRYITKIWTNIKPDYNNPGSTTIWRVSDKNYPYNKMDY